MPSVTPLLDAPAMARALSRMASEVVEKSGGTDGLVLVGIQRRGVELAARLAGLIATAEGRPVGPRPVVGETSLPGEIEGRTVVIVDDVLYTGRTVRAALDELTDFGRPRRILLSVLVDRGGRELPIQADVVGVAVTTAADDRVDVAVQELDGRDQVELVRGAPV
ncbi:MAG: bifunctional pyr operon transcriptional regulator/uracil phosphoribosyltransferase [Gemmatimonadetes bacterium]|nr:MAG: bifunctional pyr operon transcriptional regulator/uracil phosphoribosyltransferase [Gemmatimonadota bacterium]